MKGKCHRIFGSSKRATCQRLSPMTSRTCGGCLATWRLDLLAPWIRDGQPDDAVFEVAATFPMEKMRTGIVREGLPFDVEEFVKRIG